MGQIDRAAIKVKVDCLDTDDAQAPFYQPRFLESKKVDNAVDTF